MQGRSIILTVTASLFFAGSTYLSKLLGSGQLGEALHPLQITHSRFMFGFLTALVFFLATRSRIEAPNLKLHLLRSPIGYCGVAILFIGILHIPASDAVALIFLNPVFAMVFAALFLKELVGRHRWTAAVAAFLGGIMLIRPEGASADPVALLCVLGAILVGLEIIIIKILASREGTFQILLLNNAFATVLASLPLIHAFTAPAPSQWAALVAVGGLMVTGQMLFLFAMRASDASLVAPFVYSTLVFVALLDLAILGIAPDMVSLGGMAIIIASGSYIAMREHRQRPTGVSA